MKCYFLVLLTGFFLLAGCVSSTKKQQNKSGIPIIFETDMGNDIDDALALDMLYKYSDMGIINLLGVSTNKDSPYSIEFLDLMNTWYGYPEIPMGKITKGADCENDAINYVKATCLYREDGKPPFKRTCKDYGKIPEAPQFYRKLLAEQPDNSVVLVSVGFSTNIARLLDTQPDQFSPLAGKELVAKKVKLLSMMAGNVVDSAKEYNIVKDIPAAQKVFSEWPTPIVMSPFDVGQSVLFPAAVIENNLTYASPNPLKIAYESYLEMPYNRPCWDLTSVLYAVEGTKNYFNISGWGKIEVDDEAHTRFYPDPDGKHAYLSISEEQAETIKNRLVELVSTKPKNK
ncbi:MAG: nucleoside hydrolase [Bacteroidales bacterium]|jgi:inosine-uridine nucleoside N-ribohydrolase|nr:nucleoside hydrolase [Bacteroidales bacterium]